MGRTLHFTLKKLNGKNFTEKELGILHSHTEKYNMGTFEDVWSCENFELDFFNSNNYRFTSNSPEAEKIVNKRFSALRKSGKTEIETFKILEKENLIEFFQDYNTNAIEGFCKVQGNEYNSLIVFVALVELSKLMKGTEIKLSDEGHFLFCPLKIQNGKALPLLEPMIDDIKRYSMLMLFSKGFKGNILKKLNLKAKDFCHEFQMGINIENSYGDMTNYINGKLRDIKEVEKVISPLVQPSNQMYFENLEHRNPQQWFDPFIFTRPVKIDDFKEYVMSPATFSAGNEGEYWKLTDEDTETRSYKDIGQLQKMFKMLGLAKNLQDTEILGVPKE